MEDKPCRVEAGASLLPGQGMVLGGWRWEGTHHSWSLSTRTGSLPSPRGTWGQQCGGTSPSAVGTESRRTCTWGDAGRVASGSRCCCSGGSLSGTWGRKERASAAGTGAEQSPPLVPVPGLSFFPSVLQSAASLSPKPERTSPAAPRPKAMPFYHRREFFHLL